MLVPQVQPRRKVEEGVKRQKSRSERPGTNRKTSPVVSSTTCGPVKDDRSSTCFRQYPRDLSRSPPPAFHYSCPLPEPAIQAPYPQHAPFSAVPGHFADFQPQSLYLPPLPVTLPSMSSFDPAYVKNESLFCDDDMFGQFNLGYSPLTGMDIPAGQMYQESNVHVSDPKDNTESNRPFPLCRKYLMLISNLSRPLPCRILTRSNTQGRVPPQQFSPARRYRYLIRHDWLSDSSDGTFLEMF